ncbi:hypothetical protein GCK32_018409 [Trichostrongylus colubriformis]|uniref:Uncharacterized protein n=1 Tax=Trichostrongylus colubriformis TaxID=6319 RepID=A0AAN8IH85_TRICO
MFGKVERWTDVLPTYPSPCQHGFHCDGIASNNVAVMADDHIWCYCVRFTITWYASWVWKIYYTIIGSIRMCS